MRKICEKNIKNKSFFTALRSKLSSVSGNISRRIKILARRISVCALIAFALDECIALLHSGAVLAHGKRCIGVDGRTDVKRVRDLEKSLRIDRVEIFHSDKAGNYRHTEFCGIVVSTVAKLARFFVVEPHLLLGVDEYEMPLPEKPFHRGLEIF